MIYFFTFAHFTLNRKAYETLLKGYINQLYSDYYQCRSN